LVADLILHALKFAFVVVVKVFFFFFFSSLEDGTNDMKSLYKKKATGDVGFEQCKTWLKMLVQVISGFNI
jgi:hypothetical protein